MTNLHATTESRNMTAGLDASRMITIATTKPNWRAETFGDHSAIEEVRPERFELPTF